MTGEGGRKDEIQLGCGLKINLRFCNFIGYLSIFLDLLPAFPIQNNTLGIIFTEEAQKQNSNAKIAKN